MAAERPYKSTPHTRKGATTTFGSRTDIGCLRDHNEDSLVVAPPLFAVADGMGGHAAGDYVSSLIVDSLRQVPASARPRIPTPRRWDAPWRRRTAPSSSLPTRGGAARAWAPP